MRRLNPSGVIAALNAFKDALKGETVSQEEFTRRARICSVCPRLRNVSGVVSRVSLILGDLSIKHSVPPDISDKMCGVCGCSMMLLLPATKENLHTDSAAEAARRPGRCWLRRENLVDKPR